MDQPYNIAAPQFHRKVARPEFKAEVLAKGAMGFVAGINEHGDCVGLDASEALPDVPKFKYYEENISKFCKYLAIRQSDIDPLLQRSLTDNVAAMPSTPKLFNYSYSSKETAGNRTWINQHAKHYIIDLVSQKVSVAKPCVASVSEDELQSYLIKSRLDCQDLLCTLKVEHIKETASGCTVHSLEPFHLDTQCAIHSTKFLTWASVIEFFAPATAQSEYTTLSVACSKVLARLSKPK